MDLTTIFSDDQLAVMGCFGALAVCGLIAAITFQFGPAGRQSQEGHASHLQLAKADPHGKQRQSRKAA